MTAAGSVPATLFRICTDATLPAAVTLIRPAHLNELQAAIATPRSRRGRSPAAWTDPTPPGGTIPRHTPST